MVEKIAVDNGFKKEIVLKFYRKRLKILNDIPYITVCKPKVRFSVRNQPKIAHPRIS